MSRRLSPLAALRSAAVATAARPHLLLLLLGVNLLAAWTLAAPVRGVLAAELDSNLYGETMRTGASWRWFDTVSRRHPQALGDPSAFTALLSDEGVRWRDLKRLSGPAAGVALAGLFLFWVNGMLHCGFLGSLHPKRGGFGAATARFAPPASALALFAAATYVTAYALLYVQTGRWLAPAREAMDSEWLAMAMTWGRLGITLAALLAIKVCYDLTRVVMVERDSWNWPWALLLAARELAGRGGAYLVPYLLVALATPLGAALWWATGARIAASGWLFLTLLFLLHQAVMALRIGLRLTQLAATRALYRQSQALSRSARPPYKVEAPGEPGGAGG